MEYAENGLILIAGIIALISGWYLFYKARISKDGNDNESNN